MRDRKHRTGVLTLIALASLASLLGMSGCLLAAAGAGAGAGYVAGHEAGEGEPED